MNATNRQFRLAARPVGLPKDSDWDLVEEPAREPDDGEIVVRVTHISLDPAMRGWMNEGRSYVPPVQIGEVMRAFAGGEVVESRSPEVAVGDQVTGLLGVQEYATLPAQTVFKVDTGLVDLPVYLSTLGMPGMTAYFGLLDIGRPADGETVLVSGAAGAVGGLVGQIAKLKGAQAVGTAGGPEKCRHVVDELGFDACVDYKAADFEDQLTRACSEGIDVYFDNVGGEILDAALARLNRNARVVICGAISQYNATGAMRGPGNYLFLLINHASMTGFVVTDYMDRYAEGGREMAEWVAAGQIKSREDIAEGLENFPDTLLRLFEGDNVGKLVLKVA